MYRLASVHRATTAIEVRLQLLEHQLSCIEGESAAPRAAAAGETSDGKADGSTAAPEAGAAPGAGGDSGAGGGSVGMRNKDRPDLARFFKMVAMGVPLSAVKHKMAIEGFDESLLDDPDGEADVPAGHGGDGAQGESAAGDGGSGESAPVESVPDASVTDVGNNDGVKNKDHPELKQFFKMMVSCRPIAYCATCCAITSLCCRRKLTPAALAPSHTIRPAQHPYKKGDGSTCVSREAQDGAPGHRRCAPRQP